MSSLHLVVLGEDGKETRIALNQTVTIGRAQDAELSLSTQGISRHHCRVDVDENGIFLQDLGSTNGCFVNGEKADRIKLHPGDTIVIGRQTLRVEDETSDVDLGAQTLTLGSASIEKVIRADALDSPPAIRSHERAALYLTTLYRITESINHERNRESLYRDCLEAMMDALNMDLGVVFLSANGGGTLATLKPHEILDRDPSNDYEPSGTVLAQVMNKRQLVVASDLSQSPQSLAHAQSLVTAGVARIYAGPLLNSSGTPFGAIYLSSRTGRVVAGDDDAFAFFGAALRQIGMASDNRQKRQKLERENDLLKNESTAHPDSLIGQSPPMNKLRALMERAAGFDTTVLICGETGSGKELVARGIHDLSRKEAGLFVAVNCGAIPSTMMESELFGHEKGSFTGADQRKIGKIELAHGGTMFLDEIAELSAELQVKLLRVLEERSFYRVGGTEEVRVDVRFVAATHRDLQQRVKEGLFREDLLFRLQVLELIVPPLRTHLEDLQDIAEVLLERLAERAGHVRAQLSEEAIEKLVSHSWPGNVRELRNVLERAIIIGDGMEISPDSILIHRPLEKSIEDGRLATLKEVEKAHVLRVLDSAGWNKTEAAEILGIGRPTVYEKIKAYGLEPRRDK